MNERRPPAPPAAPLPAGAAPKPLARSPRSPWSEDAAKSAERSAAVAAERSAAVAAADAAAESTILAPRPELTDQGSMEGGVFDGDSSDDDDLATRTMKAPGRRTTSSTADISVIEARELRPAPSDSGFDSTPRAFDFDVNSDGALMEDTFHPATEVLRLAFTSDPGGDSLTPTGDVDVAARPEEGAEDTAPIEVRKWKAGGGGRRPVPLGPISEEGQLDHRGPMISLPQTRVEGGDDAAPGGAGIAGTRVDAVPAGARHAPFDVDELRRTLEEAEKLLRTVKHQASSLDLDLVAPAARGMNAQLAAALHRLGEALAMLGR